MNKNTNSKKVILSKNKMTKFILIVSSSLVSSLTTTGFGTLNYKITTCFFITIFLLHLTILFVFSFLFLYSFSFKNIIGLHFFHVFSMLTILFMSLHCFTFRLNVNHLALIKLAIIFLNQISV